MTQASRRETFYAVHKERPFFGELVDFMISAPVVVQVLEGENAIAKYREVMGATNPANAADGTIRKLFAKSVGENSVHGSDAPETAAMSRSRSSSPATRSSAEERGKVVATGGGVWFAAGCPAILPHNDGEGSSGSAPGAVEARSGECLVHPVPDPGADVKALCLDGRGGGVEELAVERHRIDGVADRKHDEDRSHGRELSPA